MTDWDTVLEYIHNAMQALDQAHEASENLRSDTNHDTFDDFRAKMAELSEHLTQLQKVLNNEEAYAMDELIDALSMAYTGKRTEYRRTPRYRQE